MSASVKCKEEHDLPRSVLDRTVDVLRQAEHLLIPRTRGRWKRAEIIVDSLWHGPSFVLTGLALQLRLLGVGVVLTVIWWGALLLIAVVSGERFPIGIGSTGWVAIVMATASLVFRAPSAGSLQGVRRTAVLQLAAYIRHACPDAQILGSVKANLSSLSELSDKRSFRIQAFLGLYWAALLWWVVTWVLPPTVVQATRGEAAVWAFIGGFFFVFAGLAFIGYATASRIFWQTVELAFSEVEAGMVPNQ